MFRKTSVVSVFVVLYRISGSMMAHSHLLALAHSFTMYKDRYMGTPVCNHLFRRTASTLEQRIVSHGINVPFNLLKTNTSTTNNRVLLQQKHLKAIRRDHDSLKLKTIC